MTRLERALEIHPDLSEERIINHHCPEELIKCNIASCPITNIEEFSCDVCWNMEYKEVEHDA